MKLEICTKESQIKQLQETNQSVVD